MSPAGAAVEMSSVGIVAHGYDIWSGGGGRAVVPRVLIDAVEKFLGKRGSVLDKHGAARGELEFRLLNIRAAARSQRASWDEVAAVIQLVVRGVLCYAPLVGLPSPSSLHSEDAAYHRLVLAGLGTRCSAERVSLLAPRSISGVQLSSAVESCIAATARDLLWVLNGQCLSGTLARDALREAFMVPAEVADEFVGILPDAMRFLAGYGIYICVGTDRVVSRILNALAHAFRSPAQQLIGQFDKSAFAAGRRWCRVGRVSNAVRAAVRALDALRAPHDAWASPGTWEGVLSNAAGVSCQAVATAARRALEQSYQDWDTECTMFARASATGNPPPENWGGSAWEDPWAAMADARSAVLDAAAQVSDALLADGGTALFSDGGYTPGAGGTFSAQLRTFGDSGRYWADSAPASEAVVSRMPARFGYEPVTIHTAELAGLVAALRWRCHSEWNLAVCDRSSLFSVMESAVGSRPIGLLKYTASPLVWRLRSLLVGLTEAWAGDCLTPPWRLDQQLNPNSWNVYLPELEGGKLRCWSRIAFQSGGVIGVDVKSHQGDFQIPYPAVVQGNDAQDALCGDARGFARPPDPGNTCMGHARRARQNGINARSYI